MTHLEDQAFTNTAVVRASRLQLVALGALPVPEATQIVHGLGAVLHKPLHVLLQAFEAVILAVNVLLGARASRVDTFNVDLGCFAILAALNFFA